MANTNSFSLITSNFLKTKTIINTMKIVEKFLIFSLLNICALADSKNRATTKPANTKHKMIKTHSTIRWWLITFCGSKFSSKEYIELDIQVGPADSWCSL